jgi:hypothetical protein
LAIAICDSTLPVVGCPTAAAPANAAVSAVVASTANVFGSMAILPPYILDLSSRSYRKFQSTATASMPGGML